MPDSPAATWGRPRCRARPPLTASWPSLLLFVTGFNSNAALPDAVPTATGRATMLSGWTADSNREGRVAHAVQRDAGRGLAGAGPRPRPRPDSVPDVAAVGGPRPGARGGDGRLPGQYAAPVSDHGFWAVQSLVTQPGPAAAAIDQLPSDLGALRAASRQLVFHRRQRGGPGSQVTGVGADRRVLRQSPTRVFAAARRSDEFRRLDQSATSIETNRRCMACERSSCTSCCP